jgi:two-component system response regulator
MLPSQITSHFGASVRKLRHRLGISQEVLAERADLHRTYITGIECGTRNVTLKCLEKLARALEVSPDALLLQAVESNARADGEPTAGKCVHILLVEDNREDVELTLEAFKQARIRNAVHVVRDGKEALDFLFRTGNFVNREIQAQPQLVLLDLNLPKIDGKEVLRRIKRDERTRRIPVVVLTTSRDSQDIAICRRLGAETYIVKPVNFQSLGQATPQLNYSWALFGAMDNQQEVQQHENPA